MKDLRALHWLSLLASFISFPTVLAEKASNDSGPSQWPLHDNGLNDVVQWDHYSFKVNGKRLFVFSGE